MDLERLRVWQAGDFRLDLYYNGTSWGRVRLAYELRDRRELIFAGDNFYPSPLHAYDGDEAVAALLGFLALQPGDTDRAYFAEYTDRQLAWTRERAAALTATIADSQKRRSLATRSAARRATPGAAPDWQDGLASARRKSPVKESPKRPFDSRPRPGRIST